MKGYHNNDDATKNTIVDDGWIRTGDIAHYDEDGQFYITDRLKELIKVNTQSSIHFCGNYLWLCKSNLLMFFPC